MINEIYNAYVKYRAEIYSQYISLDYLKVVILTNPENFHKLMQEIIKEQIHWSRYEDIYYFDLGGEKTPVIIDDEIPKEVEFQLLSQKDYERHEQEKNV